MRTLASLQTSPRKCLYFRESQDYADDHKSGQYLSVKPHLWDLGDIIMSLTSSWMSTCFFLPGQAFLTNYSYLTAEEIEDVCTSCGLTNYKSDIRQSFIMFTAQKPWDIIQLLAPFVNHILHFRPWLISSSSTLKALLMYVNLHTTYEDPTGHQRPGVSRMVLVPLPFSMW